MTLIRKSVLLFLSLTPRRNLLSLLHLVWLSDRNPEVSCAAPGGSGDFYLENQERAMIHEVRLSMEEKKVQRSHVVLLLSTLKHLDILSLPIALVTRSAMPFYILQNPLPTMLRSRAQFFPETQSINHQHYMQTPLSHSTCNFNSLH